MADRLNADEALRTYDQLDARNGGTRLVMQDDGNLVLYRNDTNRALWDTRTVRQPVTRAIMQGDGNFVLYADDNRVFWATGTDGHPGAYLVLQDDGNLVLYSRDNNPLWASNTVQDFDPLQYDSGDVHLATGEWMHTIAKMSSSGVIEGDTQTWSTIQFRGFHASVAALTLDDQDKVIWPPNPQVTKRQYGVDGPAISRATGFLALAGFLNPANAGPSRRTDHWVVQVPSDVLPRVRKITCLHFLDPKNMLLTDLVVGGQTLAAILQKLAVFLAR